jgi:predicted DNA-binding transcriptional regulator AlpA
MKEKKEFLTIEELCLLTGYSKRTIYNKNNKIYFKGIHFLKPGGKLIYIRVAIEAWLRGEEPPSMDKNLESEKSQNKPESSTKSSETQKPQDKPISSIKSSSYKRKSKPKSKTKSKIKI